MALPHRVSVDVAKIVNDLSLSNRQVSNLTGFGLHTIGNMRAGRHAIFRPDRPYQRPRQTSGPIVALGPAQAEFIRRNPKMPLRILSQRLRVSWWTARKWRKSLGVTETRTDAPLPVGALFDDIFRPMRGTECNATR